MSIAKKGTEKILLLPCRYYRVYTDPDIPCSESNFHHVARELPIPVRQAAIVLVDVWSTHYIDSWLRRGEEITQARIVPLLDAARRAGMMVVHGPSPIVAQRYNPSPRLEANDSPQPVPDWPPANFRGIYREGEFAVFGRHHEPRLKAAHERYPSELDIAEAARPLPGEPVIHNGAQMHDILAERQILHLFYVGFATNWCVILRDYGIVAMGRRGYNPILVRDATTGIEFHDTVKTLTATEMAIREIETKYAWSTTTQALIDACNNV